MTIYRCLMIVLAIAALSHSVFAKDPGAEQVKLTMDLRGFTGPVNDLSFSPDGQFLAACGGKEVRLYEVRTGRLLKTLRGQIDGGSYGDCLAVAFSPDNCQLVVGIGNTTEHGSLRVYDTDNFHQIDELAPGHELPVTRLAFNSDGRYLATADSEGGIQIFDWPLRKIVGRAAPLGIAPRYSVFQFPLDDLLLLTGEKEGFSIIAAPAGRRLQADPRVRKEMVRWVNEQPKVQYPDQTAPTRFDVKLSRDSFIAGGQGKSGQWIGFWRGSEPAPRIVYRRHVQQVTALALNATCTVAASGDALGKIHLWDTASGETMRVLSSQGQPIYRAAFDAEKRQLGFGVAPARGTAWTYNAFGRIDRQFDFNMRGVFGARDDGLPDEVTKGGRASLQISFDKAAKRYGLRVSDEQGRARTVSFAKDVVPSCYTLLDSGRMGLKTPLITSDFGGGLFGYDGATGRQVRNFLGHEAMITAITQSTDGQLLITSSTDRTIRMWNLQAARPTAWVGFHHVMHEVTGVPQDSAAQRADIRAGDRLLAMDGHSLSGISAMQANGTYDYQVGQRVSVTLERSGVAFETEIPLVAGPDLVEPVLSMLILEDGRWIMWTPQGYYDASPGAGSLIGFHINRGVDRAADFVPVHQFRGYLYRPDVINHVLSNANVQQAIEDANENFAAGSEPIDLRDSDTIDALAPPKVRILSPSEGAVTNKGVIFVLGEVVSQDDRPITDVRVMVNGRPGLAKGMAVVAADDAPRTRLSFNKAVSLLPGENTISVFASNGAATSVPVSISVTYDAPESVRNKKPKLHIVSIGVSDYKNPQLNLRYAHLDAEQFAEAWKGQRGLVYEDVQTKVLLNEEAASQKVRAALTELLSGATRTDVAVIFISAHGVRDKKLEYYLATHDVDGGDLRGTAVHFSTITNLLENLSCKVLMFVDTCHSAGITGAKALVRDPLYELSSEEYGAVVFSSSLSREVSYENEEWGHGAFTKAILDTFGSKASDLNEDGYLSLTELEQRVYDQVREMTQDKQTPVMSRPPTIPNLRFYYVGNLSS